MKIFEDFVKEALRAKDKEYSPIIKDVIDILANPTSKLKAKLKRALNGKTNRAKKIYEAAFEEDNDDAQLIVQILYSPVPEDLGRYEDYETIRFLLIFLNPFDLYSNFETVKRGEKLVVNEDVLDEYINTCEHELTHFIQHKRNKHLFLNHNYSDEVVRDFDVDDDSAKKCAAMLVYYLFNDIEWEAHQTSAAHKNPEDELDMLQSWFEIVISYIKFYEEIHNKHYYWPQKYKQLIELKNDIKDFEEFDNKEEFQKDIDETIEYLARILANHYKNEDANNIDKYVNLFLRECSRRIYKFIKHYRKNMKLYSIEK